MQYEKISPLGSRIGHGTFETIFDSEKYSNLKEAEENNDYVILDFVIDTDKIKHIECYHVRTPETKVYHRIGWQNFPYGLDARDDFSACELGSTLLIK